MIRNFPYRLFGLFLLVGCATPVKLEPILEPVPIDHPANPHAIEAPPTTPSVMLRQESQDMTRTNSAEPSMEEMEHPGHSMSHEEPASGGQTSLNVYTCTMHPEVIQTDPGACPKCGMSLVAGIPYTCTMHPEVLQTDPGACPKCGMSLVVGIPYTCPMHPEVIRTTPGTCPKCGMSLVKKESTE